MEILYVIAFSAASIIVLFFLCKLMGYRQLSQMSMFDYINGITIGSIAAEMAISASDDIFRPLTAMITYGLIVSLLSIACNKSLHIRHFISGKPIILFNHNTLFIKNFARSKIDLNEFLTQCRLNGYFDLSQLETVILEDNGSFSFLPKSDYRPSTPSDFNLTPASACLVANIIIDGRIIIESLKASGKDQNWLDKQISNAGYQTASEIFLATCDLNNNFTAYGYADDQKGPDILA